ncbi:DsbA family protein [Chitinophaga lutea]
MAKLRIPVSDADHRAGNLDAPNVLVEYGDYQCPHCGLAHPLLQRLLKAHSAEVQLVFRNFPLQESHPMAMAAALAAEAAALQGKFWPMHDLIFENQNDLDPANILGLARKLGLDLDRFAHDWRSQALMDRVEADFEGGLRSGVNGTPTFFLNGARVEDYDETYESLVAALRGL